MAVDFAYPNTSRYYSVPDSDDFSMLASEDWTWGFLYKRVADVGATTGQLLSTGGWALSKSVNIYDLSNSGFIGVLLEEAGDFTASQHNLATAIPADKWALVGVNKIDGDVTPFACVLGSDDLITTTRRSQTTTTLNLTNPLEIASRVASTARYLHSPLARAFFVKGTVQERDLIDLANGKALDSFGWYKHIVLNAGFHSSDSANFTEDTGRHLVTRVGDTAYGSNVGESDIFRVKSPVAVATVASTTEILLAGAPTAVATLAGDLTPGASGVALAGTAAAAVATLAGELRIGVQLAGAPTAVATLAGDLTPGASGVALAGTAAAVATATGDLRISALLAANAAAVATATGDLNGSLLEEIIAMAAKAQGKRKSDFPALDNIPADASFDFVSAGTNYKIPIADFLTSLNVSGTVVQDGAITGVPILDPQGTVNNIRNIEPGAGISASVSAENGLALSHNFQNGSGGVPILTGPTLASPTLVNLVAGTGITITAISGGVEISLT